MARLLRSAFSLSSSQVCRSRIVATHSQISNFSSKAKKKSKSNGGDSGEENLSKKDLALQQALDQITASFGKGAIMWLGRSASPRHVPVVSTGSFSLDLALGIGGLPKVVLCSDGGAPCNLGVMGYNHEQAFSYSSIRLHTFVTTSTGKSDSFHIENSETEADSLGGGQVNNDNTNLFFVSRLAQAEAEKMATFLNTIDTCLNVCLDVVDNTPVTTPEGRVVEIYGPEASGKTTLALHVIAESQKHGGYCVFVDAEHALDPTLAESIGVNTENLLLSQPDSGEQALSLVDTLIRSGSVDVVVVDSVAALVPKGELEGEMGDAHMAMQARLMSQALRKLSHSLSLSQTILIFTNQIRSKLSTFSGFAGPSEVTSGGNALKFYASVRLNVKRIGLVKKGEETVGSQVSVKVVKNKHAPPFKTAQFELEFGKGISMESELIDLGCKHKFIIKNASFFNFNGTNYHGKDAIKCHLVENPAVREELIEKLREKLFHTESEKAKESEAEATDEDPHVEAVSFETTEEEIIAAVVEA